MKFLIAPNAFKGCLSAREAAAALARGVSLRLPSAILDLMPISDGGDGLMEVLLERHGGRRVSLRVTGPLGTPLRASYALLSDGRTAVVEMAQASGLARLPRGRLDPLHATSYGTGELIRDALRRGCRRILVGMGGSAASDGGAGMAMALGARLMDARGRPLPLGAAALERLERVEAASLERVRAVAGAAEILAISDVTNPLLGPRGSAQVYGPQKGATPFQVRLLERAHERYSRILERDLGRRVARLPGAGAAGGLGAGLAAFLRARLVPGAQWVLSDLRAQSRLARADCVITGEGRLDAQSFYGKAPLALARMAKAGGVPVLAVCGQLEDGLGPRLRRLGVTAECALMRPGEAPARAMRLARARLTRCAAAMVRAWLACAVLIAVATAAPSGSNQEPGASDKSSFAEIDRLYLHRNQDDNLRRSIDLLQFRLRANPRDAEALWRLGRSLVRRGELRARKKDKLADFDRADAVTQRAISLSSGTAEAYYWRGLALGRKGETRGVLRSLFLVGPLKRCMLKTIELDPRNGGAHHVLGEMLRQIPAFAGGSKARAVEELEQAVRLEPNEVVHYTALAQAYLDVGERAKAAQTLRSALEIKQPADPAEYDEDMAEARRMLKKL